MTEIRGVLGQHFQKSDLPPPPPDLPGTLLMRCVSGSQAYGMATEASDVDIRGIFAPTLDYLLGFLKRVEQIERKPETVIYALQKYMMLAAGANPNILELLFVPENCLLDVHPLYQLLVDNRKLFLSRKARWSYCGYAKSQVHRVNVHRRWLLNPPKAEPRRRDWDLPDGEALVSREQLGAFYVLLAHILRDIADTMPDMMDLYTVVLEIVNSEAFPGWEGVIQSRGIPEGALPYVQKLTHASDNFIYALQREQAYYRAVDEWKKYQNWKKTRNPARAELEAKFGLDSKHASHVARLMEQGAHLMETGELVVWLPNAPQIRAIRDGVWLDGTPLTYEKLVEYADRREREMQELYKSPQCPLPKDPDRKALDELCVEVVCKANEVPVLRSSK